MSSNPKIRLKWEDSSLIIDKSSYIQHLLQNEIEPEDNSTIDKAIISLEEEGKKEDEKKVLEPYQQPNNGSKTSSKLYTIKLNKINENKIETGLENEEELLLLTAPKETDEIFRALGIPSQTAFLNSKMYDSNIINTYQKMYPGCEAFKATYIKELACKLYLQILPVSSLHAYLDVETVKYISNFHEKFDTLLNHSSYYILAPREYFTPKYKGKKAKTFIIFFISDKNESRRSDFSRIKPNDTLVQLYSSGQDFKSSRRWLKYISNYREKEFISKLVNNVALLSLLFLTSFLYFTSNIIVTIVIQIILLSVLYATNIKFYSHYYWNRKYRYNSISTEDLKETYITIT